MANIKTSAAAVRARMTALLKYQTNAKNAVLSEVTGMLNASKDSMESANKKPNPGSVMQILNVRV